MVNCILPLTIFAKSSFLGVWQGSKYTSDSIRAVLKVSGKILDQESLQKKANFSSKNFFTKSEAVYRMMTVMIINWFYGVVDQQKLLCLISNRNHCYQKSSRPEMFCKKGVLKNFTKFTGKQLCQSLVTKNTSDGCFCYQGYSPTPQEQNLI